MRWFFVVTLIPVVGGAVFFGLSYSHKTARWNTFSDPTTHVVLEYPPSLVSQPITGVDQNDKIIFRAAEPATGNTPVLVTLRYEDGLRVLTNLVKRDLLDILVENSGTMHPERFPGYRKISEQKFERNGKKAAEITFTYQGPAGESIQERFLIIVRDDDLAAYLAAQAKERDFEEINKRYLERIFENVRFE